MDENIDLEVELADETPAHDEEPKEATQVSRKRLEDKQGPGFVDFVRNFIVSKGQGAVSDRHRLDYSGEVFGAPIRAIAEAAKAAGYPCTRGGILNMLSPTRKDSKSNRRGIIEARPVSNHAGEKRWHCRSSFSASLCTYDKQSIEHDTLSST